MAPLSALPNASPYSGTPAWLIAVPMVIAVLAVLFVTLSSTVFVMRSKKYVVIWPYAHAEPIAHDMTLVVSTICHPSLNHLAYPMLFKF